MEIIKAVWRKTPHFIRKPIVLFIGCIVVAAGLAMMILPGPGVGTIILGFAILATEFAMAARVRDWILRWLKRIFKWLKKRLSSSKS